MAVHLASLGFWNWSGMRGEPKIERRPTMAKGTSEKPELIVSLMGMIEQVIIALVKFIKEVGGNVGECICYLASAKGEETLRKIAEMIVAEARQAAEVVSKYFESTWAVVVDFSQDLGQMISAGGYDSVHPEITAEHFPVKGIGKTAVKVELLHFDRYFNNGDAVIAELEAVNQWLAEQKAGYRYRFARIEELLALGATQRDLQRKFPIAALGSIRLHPGGSRDFADLDGGGRRRYLHLGRVGDGFRDGWRFAVVREQVAP